MKKKVIKDKIVSLAVEPEQSKALRKLAQLADVSMSSALRRLIPSTKAIDAFLLYQAGMPDKEVLGLFSEVHREFAEQLMIQHQIFPLRLQVKTVAAKDETGDKVFQLFETFTRALRKERGYRFENITLNPKGYKKFEFFVVLKPRERKEKVCKMVAEYFADNEKDSIQQIKLAGRERKSSDRVKEALTEVLRVVFGDKIEKEVKRMFDEAVAKEAKKRGKEIR